MVSCGADKTMWLILSFWAADSVHVLLTWHDLYYSCPSIVQSAQLSTVGCSLQVLSLLTHDKNVRGVAISD